MDSEDTPSLPLRVRSHGPPEGPGGTGGGVSRRVYPKKDKEFRSPETKMEVVWSLTVEESLRRDRWVSPRDRGGVEGGVSGHKH